MHSDLDFFFVFNLLKTVAFPLLNYWLPSAFRSLKEYYLEAKAKNTELKAKLKQRDRRGSHSQVHQERDELQSLLQKSYLAYKEMYEQNEQLEMKRLKLAEELRQSQEVLAQVMSYQDMVDAFEEAIACMLNLSYLLRMSKRTRELWEFQVFEIATNTVAFATI